jgi:trk system potassium uptake protein TrkA
VKLVQSYSNKLTHVVEADSTDIEAMRQVGAEDFQTAVVAIGTELEASILTTAVLVDLRVPRIVAKAITQEHGTILERVGATRVVFPERDMGVRVGHSLAGSMLDYFQLDPGFALVETRVPKELVGKTLAQAEVRKRYGITVVCVKPEGGSFTYATPETIVNVGDILVVAGETKRAEAFGELT